MVSHAFAGTVVILRVWGSALWGKIATCLSPFAASFAFFLMLLADLQTLRIPRPRNRMRNHSFFWRPFLIHFYAQKNQLVVSWFLLYLQNYIHADISLRFITSCDSWSSPHPISNSQLHALLHFHLCPIYLVVFKGVYFFTNGISHLKGGFTLRCLQRLSLPGLATRP